MGHFDKIYEFGSGTGQSLVAAPRIYPKEVDRYRFFQSAVNLISEVGEPNHNLKLDSGSGVLTFGALE